MKKLGLILFILLIVYFIFLIRQDIMDNLDLKKETRQASVSLVREEKLTQELQHRLKLLDKRSYIEGLARTKLGMIKSGETAYKVID